jgi:hypothetical protein
MSAGAADQKPRRPQFMGMGKILRLAAWQQHHSRLGIERGRRLSARTRAIIERRHRALGCNASDAMLDGLMMQSERSTDRKNNGSSNRSELVHGNFLDTS